MFPAKMADIRKRNPPKKKAFVSGQVEAQKKSTSGGKESCLRKSCLYLFLSVLAFVAFAAALVWFAECPFEPEDLSLPVLPEMTGPLEPNDVLTKGKRLFVNKIIGPESFAIDKNGVVYTGSKDGKIWRIENDEATEILTLRAGIFCNDSTSLDQCSWPLGMRFNPGDGLLYIADSYHGLYSLDVSNFRKGDNLRHKLKLVWDINSKIVGAKKQPVLLNNMAFMSNGSILMSMSSTEYRMHDLRDEYMRLRPTGSLVMFNPGETDDKAGRTYTLMEGLRFANAPLLSKDESYVLVGETALALVRRYYLKGPKAGTWDIFISNTPGLPDNPTYSKRGTIWFPSANTRTNAMLQFYLTATWFRKLCCKLGIDLAKGSDQLPNHGLVLELDPEDGHVVRSYHDVLGKVVREVTEVIELDNDGNVYLGSFKAPYIVKVNLNE